MLTRALVSAFVFLAGTFSYALTPTATGLDQIFSAPYAQLLHGKRIGLLAHAASRTGDGRHAVDLFAQSKDFTLIEIFSPEHGLRGDEDITVPDSIDPVTRLPVFSLYGPRRAPTPEQLRAIDVVVIDLQDVGARYYTFGSTMAFTMQAAKDAGKKVVVLDRPNPVGGNLVEGEVLEKDLTGKISALYPIATRHGLTIGELARLDNESFGIHSDLSVIPLKNWKRSMLWEETGLPWVAPSPALVTSEQALLYVIFGPLESLNFAVGRGVTNEQAFRIFGAPWISSEKKKELVAKLNALDLPGFRFREIEWIPTRREYEGELCRGFRVEVTDKRVLQGFRSLIEVAQTLAKVLGSDVDFLKSDPDLGAHWLREAILTQQSFNSILARVHQDSSEFIRERNNALLY